LNEGQWTKIEATLEDGSTGNDVLYFKYNDKKFATLSKGADTMLAIAIEAGTTILAQTTDSPMTFDSAT
jgi:hypothetical protein